VSDGGQVLGIVEIPADESIPWEPPSPDPDMFVDICDPALQYLDQEGKTVHPAEIVASLGYTCLPLDSSLVDPTGGDSPQSALTAGGPPAPPSGWYWARVVRPGPRIRWGFIFGPQDDTYMLVPVNPPRWILEPINGYRPSGAPPPLPPTWTYGRIHPPLSGI
jgi:hypothetical protein